MTKKNASRTSDDDENADEQKKTPARKRASTANEPEPRPERERSDQERKNDFLDELLRSLGCALAACQRAGVTRQECRRWLQEDDEFAQRVQGIAEDALDFVEGKMLEEIKRGNAQLIKFYLEAKGKARGYGKRENAEDRAGKKNAEKTPVVFLTRDEMEY